MIKFYKGVATLVTAAVMLGSPMVSSAASNFDSNGQLEHTRFGSFPTIAFESDSNVVINTEDELRKAIEAVAAGADATIVISGNFAITKPIAVAGKVTLVSNDAAVLENSAEDLFSVTGELTLGKNITINSSNSILYAYDKGVINVDGAILNTTAGKNALGFATGKGTINVISGEVNGKSSVPSDSGTPAATLSVKGNGANINISGGKVTSTTSSTVLVKNDGTATITGGVVETTGITTDGSGFVAIFVKEGTTGTINIDGGTVESVYGASVDANEGTVTITDGEIIGADGYPAVGVTKGTVAISGGTFSSDIKEYLTGDYATITDGENYVVATAVDSEEKLRNAIAGVEAGEEATIVIGKGFATTTNKPITVAGKVTLVSNDAVVLENSAEDLFSVTGELTLGKNITIDSTNSILYAYNSGVINVDGAILNTKAGKNALGFATGNGTINVISGEVNGKSSVPSDSGTPAATLSVKGDGANINISGGKVTSTTSSTVLVKNDGTATITGGVVETTGITTDGSGFVAIFVKEGTTGTINIDGGTVESVYGASVDANEGTVIITDGEIIGAKGYPAVGATKGTVAISGGTFSSAIDDSYLVDGYGDVEISDGKFTVHKHIVVDVAAVDATCTKAGSTAGTKCSECDKILSGCEEIPAAGHKSVAVAAVDATCTEAGSTAGTKCSECGKILSGCEEIPAAGHKSVAVAAVDATCTEAGSTAGTKCSECDKILSGCKVIPATGHKSVAVPAVDATCTEAGLTAGTKCSECDKILSGCEEIPATGHTLTAVPAKEATTDAEGDKAYWTCECGKWFADKDAKTEITDKTSVVIPKLDAPEEPVEDVAVVYSTHVQSKGWIAPVADGKESGTTGEAKRLEAIKIEVKTDADLGISYSTHVQSKGWIDPVADGKESGTTGQSKRLEAIKIELTGADKDKYNVWYRVHAQSYGWLGWAKNGEAAGTAGQSKRLEAIEIVVLPVGETPEGNIGYSFIELGKTATNVANAGLVNYKTHVQTYGDQSYVSDGSIAGTFGEAKRLEAISINLNTELLGVDGGIKYKTHVQKYGWLDYVENGKVSGTVGEAKRLEAICIELTGDVAKEYDVYYRVHAQTYGWLGWAKNGEEAGTTGQSKRLEAIQIVLVPKGQDAPSILPGAEGTKAFIEK